MIGGTRNVVEVGVAMVLQDRFSHNAGKISSAFTGMMRDMRDWNQSIQASAGTAFETGSQVLKGMYDTYKYAANISADIFLASKMAGATAKQQQELMGLALEVNREVPLTAKDIASGQKYLAMAGNTVEQIKALTRPTARLASIFQMSMGEKGGTADLMTNIMATFGVQAEGANEVADQLTAAVTSSNISLTDLAESFKYSGADFRNAGVDISTAAAAIGVLGNQGIQASMAGTALGNMLRYLTLSLSGQKPKGVEALASIGLSTKDFVDANGNLLNLEVILNKLRDGFKGLNDLERTELAYSIFGVRGNRAISAILNAGDKLGQLSSKIRNSDGILEAYYQEYLKTPQGIISAFQSNIENLRVQVGSALSAFFNPALQLASNFLVPMANLVRVISSSELGKTIVRLGSMSIAFSTALAGFRFLSRTLTMIREAGTYFRSQNAQAGNFTRQVAGANAQYVIMEQHLRNITRMLLEITALQMKAGTSMVLTGGILGKNKKGQVYAKDPKTGKFIPRATVIGTTVGAPTPKPAGAAARSAGNFTRQQVMQRALRMKGVGTIGQFVGSRILGGLTLRGALAGAGRVLGGVLGGPIGAAVLWLPLLVEGIGRLTGALDDNTESNKSKEANDYIFDPKQFELAMRAAIEKAKNPNTKIDLTINGQPITVNSGDPVHHSLDFLYNIPN